MKAVALAHRLDEEIGELTTQVAHPWDLIRSPDGTHERMSRLIVDNDDCFSNSLVLKRRKRLGYLE